MSDAQLPPGQYLSCNMLIKPGSGGQTRALLTRSRIFHEQGGVTPRTLIFEPAPDYAERRAQLIADDVITESMPLLNLFDSYRVAPMDYADPAGGELKPVHTETTQELYTDGSPYRIVHSDPLTGQPLGGDYQREDGSIYARVAAAGVKETMDGEARVRLVDREGQVVRSFGKRAGLYKYWMGELCPGDDPVYVFMDSRNAVPRIAPMPNRPRFVLIYLMHNQHTVKDRRWNSNSIATYQRVLEHIKHLDAMVNLTERQSEDIAQKYGHTNHRFVVPNPIRPPVRPDPMPPRDPFRLAIVARLEPQKGLADAVKAFALAHEQVPEARLDLYGDGTQRQQIEDLIDRLDLRDVITMHGHDTLAQETLWTASGFFMPSVFEGYPLASLESLAHGCPVIAYDIKYGPREQIDDGIDGFLVPKGDIESMAARAVRLLRDPDLVARMSAAAFAKAEQHNHARFLRDWKHVLESALALRTNRTVIESGELRVKRLKVASGGRLLAPLLGRRTASGPEVQFAGDIVLTVGRNEQLIEEAVVTLTAISEADGALADIPLQVRRKGTTFSVRARFSADWVFDTLGPEAPDAHFRLRVDWRNSTWETFLGPAARMASSVPANFGQDGDLTLVRPIWAP